MTTSLITREMELPVILGQYPSCRPVFDRYGLTGFGGWAHKSRSGSSLVPTGSTKLV
jgi:hypothetical protein